MQFLGVRENVQANIYGHTYDLRSYDSKNVGPGDILVADDASARELVVRHRDVLSFVRLNGFAEKALPKKCESVESIRPGSSVILLKSGGIGDHILITPALMAFKRHVSNRDIKISLGVQKEMFPIYKNVTYVDQVLPLPLLMNQFMSADYYVDFSENDGHSVKTNQHITDCVMAKLGISADGSYDKQSLISDDLVSSRNVIDIFDRLRKSYPNTRLIVLNWYASTGIKSVPASLFSKLTHRTEDTVFVVVHPRSLLTSTVGNIKKYDLKVVDITVYMNTLYDYFTAVYLSDGVVCADTSTYHIAAAYSKPSLVVTGPTNSILSRDYPLCRIIEPNYQGTYCHSPCGRFKGSCPEASLYGSKFSPCFFALSDTVLLDEYRLFAKEHF